MTTALASNLLEHPTDIYDAVRASAGRVRFLEVPAHRYLVVDGAGAPGDVAYREAMGALYPVACTLHFALRRRDVAAPIGTLEGLYWVVPGQPIPLDIFASTAWRPEDWHWRLMLPIPDEATGEDVLAAIDAVAAKSSPPALRRLRIERLAEGPAAQLLHLGPYDGELATVTRLHDAIRGAGFRPHGCHHEIYVSDPNRTPPARLKTVIRQPIEA